MTDLQPWQGFYRGYHPARRAGQVTRMHIVAPLDAFARRGVGGPWLSAWCYASAGSHSDSPPIGHDLDAPLPEGLTWCTRCLAAAAERLGIGAQLADVVLPAIRAEVGT